ncbi:Cysteine dioxygenase type 1 [Willisornis vidua]|uniref:Cysteine dioxygenase n=1 Tax=Willisornis vidua TaxID=1566151 RepID=A0ABQ9DY82_9PASS|nr:Cysteine dioxygenase type 1 [Willisornis vidua]
MEQPVQTETWKARSLEELVRILHQIFAEDKVSVEEVQALMESYESNPEEWLQYAKFDQYRYTRNLVDNGNGKFNLMILCWGEGHGRESLMLDYGVSQGEGFGEETSVLQPSVEDSIGLHRVENISHTETAVSLHLYSPPFDTCNTFDQRTGHKHKVTMTFYSQFGERTVCSMYVTCEDRLRELGPFSLEERRLHGDCIAAFPVSERVYREAEEGLFIRNCPDKTRGNGFKLRVELMKSHGCIDLSTSWRSVLPFDIHRVPADYNEN